MNPATPISVAIKLCAKDPEVRKTIKVVNMSPTPQGVEFDIIDNGVEYYCFIVPKKTLKTCEITIDNKKDGLMFSEVVKGWNI